MSIKIKSVLERKNKGGDKKEYKDPPRYPNIINKYELSMKKDYHDVLEKTLNQMAEKMK